MQEGPCTEPKESLEELQFSISFEEILKRECQQKQKKLHRDRKQSVSPVQESKLASGID